MISASAAMERPVRDRRNTRPGPYSKMSPSRPEASSAPGSRAITCRSNDARRLVAPVPVAQQALVELAGRLAGQLGVEVDRTRALVMGEVLPAVREELAFEVGPGVGHVARLHDGVDL